MIEVYREIDPNVSASLIVWLERRDQLFPITDDKTGVEHLFIENDRPRDADITEEIVSHTVGFALFGDDGRLLGRYRSLERAINAMQNARIEVRADVDLDEEDWQDEPAGDVAT